MDDAANPVESFIARWRDADGRERANYQLFLTELATLLELPQPQPAGSVDRDNAYVFERRVVFQRGDGSESYGYVDLYRRGSFVLEAKDVRETSDRRYDDSMLRARSQAENYARALPADEGRPPFVVVVDVGRSIELYSEFSRSGATYTPFPDPRSHRISLDDLRNEELRERLRGLWLDPLALDPAKQTAKVTREIATHLAELAKALEQAGHDSHAAAGFLTRCLFTMFAEDVELIPKGAFRGLLETIKETPTQFVPMVGELWRAMDAGLFSTAIRADLLRFNGKLFKQPDVLPLDRKQIELLIRAAKADWTLVEPAIFGTLLERALDPTERHALGAHYTPRAYVERLVLPTVIEPLREDWKTAQATALTFAAEDKLDAALAAITTFHRRLCRVRVLDPACGSGNFLYVVLEHLKRLEGEVLNAFDELDPQRQSGKLRQSGLALDGDRADPFGGETVDPHQLLGIEINPRAAAIAELVLWIGYLQWHFRTRGAVLPPEPVLKDFRNIECRDAVLEWDRIEYATDERGMPIMRWDGKTMKTSPVTGEDVPDDSVRVPQEVYINPRRAAWPQADFVVGNPPFIGKLKIREALGDGYVEALREAWPDVPDSADFVMYWWHQAAVLTQRGALQRFGFITTNSIRQTFNRRVIEAALIDSKRPLSLSFVIPDHPWVDAADGAAVRIAMTVADRSQQLGRLNTVIRERDSTDQEVTVALSEQQGTLHSGLGLGVNLAKAVALQANKDLCNVGVIPHGEGFVVRREQVGSLESDLLHEFRNGKDLLGGRARDVLLIDTNELEIDELRSTYPGIYQWLLDRVKPDRDQNPRATRRINWWLFGENHPRMRRAIKGLSRYIVTVLTSKHRVFVFLDGQIIPDQTLVVIGSGTSKDLGVLSSIVHVTWALGAGGTLEDRPRYNKSRCFEPFPFPVTDDNQDARIGSLAEQLYAHRKRQQAAHADLTLTGMYNVLEKLRSGAALTPKERVIHEHGLVSVLKQLHDEIDVAVLDAYGWNDLAPLMQQANGNAGSPSSAANASGSRDDAIRALDDALLERLVALNAERAAEEKRGLVRWLRPEFQNPEHANAGEQGRLATDVDDEVAVAATPLARKPQPWPKDTADQVLAVAQTLSEAEQPLDETALAERFTSRGRWRERLPKILDTLVAIGRARVDDGRYSSM